MVTGIFVLNVNIKKPNNLFTFYYGLIYVGTTYQWLYRTPRKTGYTKKLEIVTVTGIYMYTVAPGYSLYHDVPEHAGIIEHKLNSPMYTENS